jgi:hypothetical protein
MRHNRRNARGHRSRISQQKRGNYVIKGVKGICLGCYEYKRLAPDGSQGEGKCWACNHPEQDELEYALAEGERQFANAREENRMGVWKCWDQGHRFEAPVRGKHICPTCGGRARLKGF